ncbi:hypothetical protein SARC_02666 [Sphaeroforma arctica JP610]|uniref:Uncharacterized protein n=1 Tax=Sphaeroforma arctica JP610 TaxID=667725 RepID=A0A0L0G7Z3_9EUKA|nr:hypothetical protein SARC_02666 [Sphaeroforma arctica JP610]KNC85142.1 hypothetical protein SARC_02666 [Sphaeroforma arctica JP610]|eukprot:XP_014159044.1 hypothetical protein SARC_02666 [Sphaeroforma arctica JP610]
MKTTISTVFLLAVAAYTNAQQELAYFSHKGKAFDVDGFDANSYSYTGFNKYGKDKYGRSYTEAESGNGAEVSAGVDGAGRVGVGHLSPSIASTADADPTESGDWSNYWPSFGHGKDRVHKKEGIVRAGNGKIIDKAWYHMSNRPAPTVTETQTQFEFTEVYITSSVAPTEDFWCDGGWIQLTKEGDLMDDDWAVAYITGYLQVIGANVDDVDTYDWCFNTRNESNAGACARQQASSHSPEDIAAAFESATDDHTSQIILFVCDLPCLDSICKATQENYDKLTPLRLTEVSFTKSSGSTRDVNTTCIDGEGIYSPPNSAGGKTFNFCPQGQVCNVDGEAQPGDASCVCEACADVLSCLSSTCYVTHKIKYETKPEAEPEWVSQPKCLPVNGQPSCYFGYYESNGQCNECPYVDNCKMGSSVCTGLMNAMCAFGGCQKNYINTAAPGGSGSCLCLSEPTETSCKPQCANADNCGSVTVISEVFMPDGTLVPRSNTGFTLTCTADGTVGDEIKSVTGRSGEETVNADPCAYVLSLDREEITIDGVVYVALEGNGDEATVMNGTSSTINVRFVPENSVGVLVLNTLTGEPIEGINVTANGNVTKTTGPTGSVLFSAEEAEIPDGSASVFMVPETTDGLFLVSFNNIVATPNDGTDGGTTRRRAADAFVVPEFDYVQNGTLVVKLTRSDGTSPLEGQIVSVSVNGGEATVLAEMSPGIYALDGLEDGDEVQVTLPMVAQDTDDITYGGPLLRSPDTPVVDVDFDGGSLIVAVYGTPVPAASPLPTP